MAGPQEDARSRSGLPSASQPFEKKDETVSSLAKRDEIRIIAVFVTRAEAPLYKFSSPSRRKIFSYARVRRLKMVLIKFCSDNAKRIRLNDIQLFLLKFINTIRIDWFDDLFQIEAFLLGYLSLDFQFEMTGTSPKDPFCTEIETSMQFMFWTARTSDPGNHLSGT